MMIVILVIMIHNKHRANHTSNTTYTKGAHPRERQGHDQDAAEGVPRGRRGQRGNFTSQDFGILQCVYLSLYSLSLTLYIYIYIYIYISIYLRST